MLFDAIWTHAMAEVSFRMFANVGLDLLPVTRVIANLLAPRANRYQAVQRPHLSQGVLQFFDNLHNLTHCGPTVGGHRPGAFPGRGEHPPEA